MACIEFRVYIPARFCYTRSQGPTAPRLYSANSFAELITAASLNVPVAAREDSVPAGSTPKLGLGCIDAVDRLFFAHVSTMAKLPKYTHWVDAGSISSRSGYHYRIDRLEAEGLVGTN